MIYICFQVLGIHPERNLRIFFFLYKINVKIFCSKTFSLFQCIHMVLLVMTGETLLDLVLEGSGPVMPRAVDKDASCNI